jgi:hypothetical protein
MRKQHKEFHNLHSPPNIFRTIKSRMMGWTGHVARMQEIKISTRLFFEKQKGRDHSEDLGVDGRIILRWILGK